jgi:hypothetical protein
MSLSDPNAELNRQQRGSDTTVDVSIGVRDGHSIVFASKSTGEKVAPVSIHFHPLS